MSGSPDQPGRQATLVAYHGLKPPELAGILVRCQAALVASLGDLYRPYDIEQIHATVIGLERHDGSSFINRNLVRYRQIEAEMDLPGWRDFLLRTDRLPFSVQVGGFEDRDYPFSSRGKRPHDRSFSIQGDKVVIMGWPVADGSAATDPADPPYPETLQWLRRAGQDFGLLHAWHQDPGDRDNDLYLRLGTLAVTVLPPSQRDELQKDMRRLLVSAGPVLLQLSPLDLFIASYLDESLPLSTTRTIRLTAPELAPGHLLGLFG